MSLTKDEVVKMAREAGAAPEDGVSGFWGAQTEDLQRFATLCRAPLVAENEGLKESLESVLSQLKERDAELARVRAGEPFGWYSAKEDDFMLDKIRKTHERLNSHTHRIGKYDLALYTTPPPTRSAGAGLCNHWHMRSQRTLCIPSRRGPRGGATGGGVEPAV